jgi:molecular chaperone DnaJ
MKIDSGTQPNSILKLRNKGLPRQNSSRRGDQYIRIVVEIPKKISKDQKNLLHDFKNLD